MDFKDGPLQSNLAFLQHCIAVTQQVQGKKQYGQTLRMRKMKCSTMTMDGKGLICMLIVGGEKRLSMIEQVCWYDCELQMFGTERGCFGK